MNALDDDGLALLECQRLLPLPLAFTRLEVVARQHDALPLKQCEHVLVEEVDIKRLQAFVVISPRQCLRRILAVDEVVVERDGDRPQPHDLHLHAQTLREGRLARRGRPRDEDQAQLPAVLGDVVGNLGDVLLLQGLRDADDLADAARADGPVEVCDIATAQDVGPVLRLGQDLRELWLRHGFRHAAAALEVWRAQEDAGLKNIKRKLAEMARRADHRAVEVVAVSAAAVDADVRQLERSDEIGLLDLLRLLEKLDRFVAAEDLLDDGAVFLNDGAHLSLDCRDHLWRQRLPRHADLAVKAVVGAEHRRDFRLWI